MHHQAPAGGYHAGALRSELVAIITKASARGNGATVDAGAAAIILDALVASDLAPEWMQCREPGRSTLRRVISEYYRPALQREAAAR